jgi:WD40-like Beta Propeller Repeat
VGYIDRSGEWQVEPRLEDLRSAPAETGCAEFKVNNAEAEMIGRSISALSNAALATMVPGSGATMTKQLWIVSLQTGKPRQLFHGSSQDTRPAWSPDGKQIAFSSDRS